MGGTTYTTAKKVEELIKPKQVFSASTTPTTATVENMINRAEDKFDDQTHHTFRETQVTEELHTIQGIRYMSTGTPIQLNHRNVLDFDTNSLDLLEVWDGNSWVDWISTKTEGRGNDFWVDYRHGELFMSFR